MRTSTDEETVLSNLSEFISLLDGKSRIQSKGFQITDIIHKQKGTDKNGIYIPYAI